MLRESDVSGVVESERMDGEAGKMGSENVSYKVEKGRKDHI